MVTFSLGEKVEIPPDFGHPRLNIPGRLAAGLAKVIFWDYLHGMESEKLCFGILNGPAKYERQHFEK